jgi:hypothetical protein
MALTAIRMELGTRIERPGSILEYASGVNGAGWTGLARGDGGGNPARNRPSESRSVLCPAKYTRAPHAEMISESTVHQGADHLLQLLRSEYLRRLARFALIDDVPTPWGAGALAPGNPTRQPGRDCG